MSRKPKTKRGAVAPAFASTPEPAFTPNWPLLALSGLGILLTGYLSWTALRGGAVQGCAAGGGCDAVLTSQWATLFGLPTSLWGLFAYAALAGIAFVRRAGQQWSYAFTVAFFGACYSVYLTVVALTMLQAACPYCLTSLALMSAILALVVWQRPPALAARPWTWTLVGRGAIAAIVILGLHANYTTPQPEPLGPEDPTVRALAEHLDDSGALFYGASCPHCQQQKALFGASASRLPYIECSPGGQNGPQSASCNAAGIQSYPTWVINGRAYVGETMTLVDLANATGFPDAGKLQ
jgi:uncharacterized membrane protein